MATIARASLLAAPGMEPHAGYSSIGGMLPYRVPSQGLFLSGF